LNGSYDPWQYSQNASFCTIRYHSWRRRRWKYISIIGA
jgi:hypothetical protein